jgi:hypothetical protein
MESSSPLSTMAQGVSGSTMDNRISGPGSSAESLREVMGRWNCERVAESGNAKIESYAESPKLMMLLFNAFVLQETVFGGIHGALCWTE